MFASSCFPDTTILRVEGKVIFLQDAEELLGSLWGVEVKLDPVWIERNEARHHMRMA